MPRLFKAASAAGLVLLLLVQTASAASVHIKGKTGPRLTDNGLTATVSACLAGLGNADVTITVTANGFGTTRCRNQGGNEAPGQNKVALSLGATATISATEIKNGTLCFRLTTEGPGDPTAAQAGCPNNNWDAYFVDVTFTSYSVEVKQNGAVVFTGAFGV